MSPLHDKMSAGANVGPEDRNCPLEAIFDQALIETNRLRTLRMPPADFLLKVAADELAERLGVIERRFDEAVEIHGYHGIVADALQRTGKIGHFTRIETDPAFAKAGDVFMAAPLEHLPLEAASINLAVSPLSLHLTNDTPGVFVQIRRALKPDGLFLAAIPGADTLQELRDVLLQVEIERTGGASPRVIPFADIRDVGALLQRAGFALPVTDKETYTVRYDSIFPLMRDLRAMGMANPLVARSRKPLSQAFFMRAAELYAERYSDPDGRIRATFTVIYASGWAPHESQQKPLKPGSAKARLADALKAKPLD